MRRSFFLYLAAVFISGIFVAASGQPLFLLAGLIFVFWRRPPWWWLVGIILFFGAIFYHQEFDSRANSSKLRTQVGETASGRALISEDIDPGGDYQKVVAIYLTADGQLGERFLMRLPAYPRYRAGEIISFSGTWEAPENWSAFRYDRYLARQEIYVLLNFPKAEKIGVAKGFFFSLWRFKARLYQKIIAHLPEPEAGLAAALMLGYRQTITADDKTVFSETGLSHLIAISGSHLSLLAGMLFLFLKRLKIKARAAAPLLIIFLWFYVALTGFSASALRSVLMSTFVLSGAGKRWRLSSGSLLLICAAIMLLKNPLLLRDDLSFQLSYLALLALIYGEPLAEAKFGQGPIRSLLILTMLVQLLTWPVSALNFGRVSLLAPVANLLVTALFTWLLPLLITNVILSFAISGAFFWAGTYLLLRTIFLISRFLASLPDAAVSLTISEHFVYVYYLIIYLLYRHLKKTMRFKKSPQLEDFLNQFKNYQN
ncbi:MAG: ComEC/Rec2 family competence protein [Candidatus Parcubacteria bacterium]|jgi:competence protein ComEC|nr:MAG: hypothetical protein JST_3990 [Candidatus Parcubacteria bacterium]